MIIYKLEHGSFHQQTGLTFKAETSEVLYLWRSFMWHWKVNTSLSRSEILWKVLKCAAGEGRRRSIGPTVWDVKNSY